jgi:hypothetical protein
MVHGRACKTDFAGGSEENPVLLREKNGVDAVEVVPL